MNKVIMDEERRKITIQDFAYMTDTEIKHFFLEFYDWIEKKQRERDTKGNGEFDSPECQ